MSIRAVPYFAFDGTAREAMEFYHSIFGGELTAHTYGEFQMVGADDPAFFSIMHTAITGGVVDLAASDYDERFGGEPLNVGNHLQVSLWGDDIEEGRRYFEALADGGKVTMPYELQPWGDNYGELVDRFGRTWSIDTNAGGDPTEFAPTDA